MNLIEVRKAIPGELPFTTNTIYKFHSTERYPEMILKVARKLFFDIEAWELLVEATRQQQVVKAKRSKTINL